MGFDEIDVGVDNGGDQRRVERVRRVSQSRRNFGRRVRARGDSDQADFSPVM